MRVKLKVLVGKSAGKEIPVPVPRFLIGRAKDCHMRPKSDAISRNHCAILVTDDKVMIRDLNSRNGTFVNENRVEKDQPLKAGDKIRVGKLEFEVIIKEGAKKKTAKSKPAPAEKPTAEARKSDSGSIDFDITEWLEEGEDGSTQAEPETRQFQLAETEQAELNEAAEDGAVAEQKTVVPPKKGQKPGKLPTRPIVQASDSGEAAADMLKKFFNNR